jgi:hypothetical protein
VLSGEHERPSAIRSDIPAIVDAWFERAFDRDKATRFGSAKDMAVAFMSLIPATEQRIGDAWPGSTVGGQSDPRLGADTFSPTRISARRWTGPALGGALLGVLVASAAAFIVWRGTHEAGMGSSAVPAEPGATADGADGGPSGADGGTADAGDVGTESTAATAGSASPRARPYLRPRPRKDAPETNPEATSAGAPPHSPTKRPARGGEDYGF